MSDASDIEPEPADDRSATLRLEGRVLCRYLLGVEPTDYALERYVAAHRARPELGRQEAIDRLLVRLAVARQIPTRVCDAYARIFAPRGLLRRKLALLLAIAESSPRLYPRVDRVEAAGGAVLVLRLGGQLAVWLLALGLGIVLLAPLHVLARISEREPRGAGHETCQPPPRGRE